MRWATFSLTVVFLLAREIARPSDTLDELLRRSDISTFAPDAFEARLRLDGDDGKTLHLEVWRSAADKTLVRFLDAKDRGKYLLRRNGVMWFLSPRALKPLRLNPSYKLSGAASLDDLLGTRYSHAYKVVGSQEQDGGVTMDLEAVDPHADHPHVRYRVDRASARPSSIALLSPSGKTTSTVTFLEWEEGARPRPRRLRITDALRPKASVTVNVTEVKARQVSEDLFRLDDGAARRALEEDSAVPSRP
jgi:Outer membrane lipoprotein-sorting protein